MTDTQTSTSSPQPKTPKTGFGRKKFVIRSMNIDGEQGRYWGKSGVFEVKFMAAKRYLSESAVEEDAAALATRGFIVTVLPIWEK